MCIYAQISIATSRREKEISRSSLAVRRVPLPTVRSAVTAAYTVCFATSLNIRRYSLKAVVFLSPAQLLVRRAAADACSHANEDMPLSTVCAKYSSIPMHDGPRSCVRQVSPAANALACITIKAQ